MLSNPAMPRLLLTAFRPFDVWSENASWLALQALTRELPVGVEVVTRLYPVDYTEVRARLTSDLATPYDAVLHVGQSAGSSALKLEQFALNVRRERGEKADAVTELEPGGPLAYRSALPLADWAGRLREVGVPAEVSLHAGDYLCNAVLYWSHHLQYAIGRTPRVALIHVPLDVTQAAAKPKTVPSLPSEVVASALRLMAGWATEPDPATPASLPQQVIV